VPVATATATAATPTTATTTAATTISTAATTATATTPAAKATATTTATRAVFLGPGFIDGQSAAVVLLAVEGGNGRLRLFVRGHLHETKPFAASGVTVVDDLR
jgi:hypothetical protein